MRPVDWINLVLKRYGLKRPDSRQLFQYRITDQEFEDLTRLAY